MARWGSSAHCARLPGFLRGSSAALPPRPVVWGGAVGLHRLGPGVPHQPRPPEHPYGALSPLSCGTGDGRPGAGGPGCRLYQLRRRSGPGNVDQFKVQSGPVQSSMRTGSKFNSIHLCEYFFWIKRLAVKGWGCDDPAIFQEENKKDAPVKKSLKSLIPFNATFNHALLQHPTAGTEPGSGSAHLIIFFFKKSSIQLWGLF